MMDDADASILGFNGNGEPLRVGDFQTWGWWLFLCSREVTDLGAALRRLLAQPSDDELAHARYLGIDAATVAKIKTRAIRTGLDPVGVLRAEFAFLELQESFEPSVARDLFRKRSFTC